MSHKSMGTYHKPRMKRGWDDISVSAIAYIIGILFAVICFVPFLLVIIYSQIAIASCNSFQKGNNS